MPVIERTRTLRPGTRLASSPYKVDTKAVSYADTLRLTIFIDGGSRRKLGEIEFRGSELARKDSFHFRVESDKAKWRVSFIGAQPITIVLQ